jgi:L-amino acid N-acyltransferase YncA
VSVKQRSSEHGAPTKLYPTTVGPILDAQRMTFSGAAPAPEPDGIIGSMTIRPARPDDVARICAIYNHYVVHSIATFEEEPVGLDEMRRRIDEVQRQYVWLVCEFDDGHVVGYAYAGRWKARAAYRFAVELSVYIDAAHHGAGAGKALYAALIDHLKRTNVHSVVGGVAGDNRASLALHESFGFQQVGRLREIGHKFGEWIDVTYFQLLL